MGGNAVKRQRGRPKGTGRHQQAKLDEMSLDQLADWKVTDPSAKTAIIIKRLIDTQTDTGGLRRLQRAFKNNELRLIAAALTRIQAQRNAAIIQQVKDGLEAYLAFRKDLTAVDQSPTGQEFRKSMRNFGSCVAELMNSPQVRPWLLALSRNA